MPESVAKRLVLASGSPRRRELLALLGVPFEVKVPEVEESLPGGGERPEEAAQRLALEKAQGVASLAGDALVLGADTLVALDGEVLGKPGTPQEAVEMLHRLRGRAHEVVTGVALVDPSRAKVWTDCGRSSVEMRLYTEEEVRRYVASGDPMDKAGAYGVQNPFFAPAERVEGCYLNVVGLPLCLTSRLLGLAGLASEVMRREVAAWCPGCALVPEQGRV